MGLFDLFSRRQAKLRGEVPDVYTYENPPNPLRVQVVHIFKDSLGDEDEYHSFMGNRGLSPRKAYEMLVTTLCREYGTFKLPGTQIETYGERFYMKEFLDFILAAPTEHFLDAVELGCKVTDGAVREWDYRQSHNGQQIATEALAEINDRFQQHGFGYRFDGGMIIRIDSELVHATVVKPALVMLHDPRFSGAEEEFLRAHEHHRHGRYKEALNDSLKSLESTLKTIFGINKWAFNPKDPCKKLLDVAYANNLIPQLWSSHFGGLRSMLESGVPTARNALGGHGQGATPVAVPAHFSAFALNQTAAAITFLVEAMNNP